MESDTSVSKSVSVNGYYNPSSICYFNSLLQALLSLQLVQKYLRVYHPVIVHHTNKLDFSFQLLQQLHTSLGISSSGQESSTEYFHFLVEFLDKTGEFRGQSSTLNGGTLYNLLSYTYLYQRQCTNCGKVSKKTEPTTCMMIEKNMAELFEYSETIENFLCEECKQKSTLRSTRHLERLGDVIILSLNKYVPTGSSVDYPDYFIVEGNRRYNLLATVEHYGSIESGGHYASRVKRGNKYYKIDDLTVMELPGLGRETSTYMLFYESEK